MSISYIFQSLNAHFKNQSSSKMQVWLAGLCLDWQLSQPVVFAIFSSYLSLTLVSPTLHWCFIFWPQQNVNQSPSDKITEIAQPHFLVQATSSLRRVSFSCVSFLTVNMQQWNTKTFELFLSLWLTFRSCLSSCFLRNHFINTHCVFITGSVQSSGVTRSEKIHQWQVWVIWPPVWV